MRQAFPDWIEQNGLIARDLKVMFVPTLKAGCTSVMWALAAAEGTLAPEGDFSELADQSRDQAIHNPRIHGLPVFSTVDGAEREEILTDPSWTRFCVTRDPYSRLVSAWLNRAFLYSTGAEQNFVTEDPALQPFPGDTDAVIDVGVRFRSFVRRLTGESDRSLVDPHFATQVSLTRPDIFPYTDIVPLSGLGGFAERLAAQAAAPTFRPALRNVSLGIRPDEILDASTAALVDDYYREDFRRFGYATREFPSDATPVELSVREVALVRMLLERSDRLWELATLKNPSRPVRDGIRRVKSAARRRLRLTR